MVSEECVTTSWMVVRVKKMMATLIMYKIISAEKPANILLPIVRRMRDFSLFFSIGLNENGQSRELRRYFQFSFADRGLVQLKGEPAIPVDKVDIAAPRTKSGLLGHHQYRAVVEGSEHFFKSF